VAGVILGKYSLTLQYNIEYVYDDTMKWPVEGHSSLYREEVGGGCSLKTHYFPVRDSATSVNTYDFSS